MTYDVSHFSNGNVMQFTGLKDKIGCEIYEGDVVEFVGGTTSVLRCGIYSTDIHKIGSVLCVQYLPSGFTLRPKSEYRKNNIPNMVGNVSQYDFWNHQRSLLVIGNVFESSSI